MTAYASNWMTTTSRSDQAAMQAPSRGRGAGGLWQLIVGLKPSVKDARLVAAVGPLAPCPSRCGVIRVQESGPREIRFRWRTDADDKRDAERAEIERLEAEGKDRR